MRRILLAVLMVMGLMLVQGSLGAGPADTREGLQKAMKDGNYKDAYDGLSKLVLSDGEKGKELAEDLTMAVQALANLGRIDEADDFVEKAVAAHPKDALLVESAARAYYTMQHNGTIVAGKYSRGGRRGGDGKWVNTLIRDRVRGLQLLRQAMENAGSEEKAVAAEIYHGMADALINGFDGSQAWRLGALTDLTTLPDYEEGYGYGYDRWGWNYMAMGHGAPVNADGTPLYHAMPKSWEAAKSDGERWRWCMAQAAEIGGKDMANRVRWEWAVFLHSQFGVQTMGYAGDWGRSADTTKKDEAGPAGVRNLGEDETIARLATGIKKFKVPDEFNYIRVCQQILSEEGKPAFGENAAELLAQTSEDRQQYMKAADLWREAIKRFGPGPDNSRQKRLAQVEGNWGQFEALEIKEAGVESEMGYRFRNGTKVSFTAQEVDVPALLDDVKAFIRTKPNNLDYERTDISNIGYRLINGKQEKYVGREVAKWEMPLEPLKEHFDKQVSVKSPEVLKKAGAYLVKAKMEGGNECFIVLWVADTAIIKKPTSDGQFMFVADAGSGKGVGGAKVEMFGYWHKWVRENTYETLVSETEGTTDATGQLIVNKNQVPNDYQYLITATTKEGRFAYVGFTGMWYSSYSDYQYDQEHDRRRAFFMTDRPVYRPGQTVKWKVWLNTAKYERDGKSEFAGQPVSVWIRNPKGEIFSKTDGMLDDFGGISGELTVEKASTLGVYQIWVENPDRVGGGIQYRVEEYKKPEFEVTVDAPKEPVMLGEKISATINAKYYFGAPVVNAKVKYKITRTPYEAAWYPYAYWDWYYEPGYWWFAYDYVWYPGWSRWGCFRPHPWWGGWAGPQPEVVSENEVPVGPDGTVKVEFDTASVKEAHGDQDHKYEISAEITDESRRTITGTGTVLVARAPFKVYAWIDRGYAKVGDEIKAEFQAQTLDHKPVPGKGTLKLMKLSFDKDGKPSEKEIQSWDLPSDEQGRARQALKASEAGQYRLSYTVTDAKDHAIEGGYVFAIRENALVAKAGDFRFNDIELIPEKREYKAGEKVRLMINTNREDATVLLFIRPTNGTYLAPKIITMKGKSTVEEIDVAMKDMPNFFVEANVVYGAKVFDDVKEIVVPPEDRVLNVAVEPSAKEYKPGEKGKIRIKVTEKNGEPFNGSAVISMYDKAVEYISGGSNVTDIRTFFWKWRRSHYARTESSLQKSGYSMVKSSADAMMGLGSFGSMAITLDLNGGYLNLRGTNTYTGGTTVANGTLMTMSGAITGVGGFGGGRKFGGELAADAAAAPMARAFESPAGGEDRDKDSGIAGKPGGAPGVEPTVRKNFADTALWMASVNTAKDGTAEVDVTMPENLSTWKTKVWTMGAGTRVGQGEAEVITTKNLIVRLQAPRFFVTSDEVVLSANVHNYLKSKKSVKVVLELDGGNLEALGGNVSPTLNTAEHGFPHLPMEQVVEVDAKGERRVDWRVHVLKPGTAVVRMKAITDEESDATEMTFPVYIHGMLKTDSFSGAMKSDQGSAHVAYTVPNERRVEDSRLEIRYSPSVATAMVDALPYMVEYPYGCTEQTLNRFLPTVVTQKILLEMKVDLAAVRDKRVNLNAQEIGDPQKRAGQWQHWDRNPVFDKNEVDAMVTAGVRSLGNMQLSDGGWGWFSGYSEHSWPHTTAVVVHGLQVARNNDVAVDDNVMARGIAWLVAYQDEQVRLLRNFDEHEKDKDWKGDWKQKSDAIDALVFMVLTDGGQKNKAMNEYLYRDRTALPVYAKALYGLSLVKLGNEKDKLDMILKNIDQFVVHDDENQTAYLKLPEGNYWWYWYGSDVEANSFYLKLLAQTDPKGKTASGLAKYLINNRKHATYWNSTRDTAYAIEALADYIRASGENAPDMTVEIAIDGKKVKEVKIDAANLFTFDGSAILTGTDVESGKHDITFTKKGSGPLYYNAYVTNFTLEDRITRAGLEVKINRKLYKLTPVDKTIKVEGSSGQALDQKVEKYARTEVPDLATLKSGDLCEVELEIDSKNDYEYILIEDMKASGFEPVEVRSGYTHNDMNAYVEFRDERVCFFTRMLARGKHSVSYKLRAETPGKFSALPAKINGMYAPELRGNSDEIKVQVSD